MFVAPSSSGSLRLSWVRCDWIRVLRSLVMDACGRMFHILVVRFGALMRRVREAVSGSDQ